SDRKLAIEDWPILLPSFRLLFRPAKRAHHSEEFSMSRFLTFMTSIALFGGMAAAPALAQDNFPDHPVQILIPNSAGGPTDTFARIMGEGMGKILGQSFVVDARPGAGGQIAARALM